MSINIMTTVPIWQPTKSTASGERSTVFIITASTTTVAAAVDDVTK